MIVKILANSRPAQLLIPWTHRSKCTKGPERQKSMRSRNREGKCYKYLLCPIKEGGLKIELSRELSEGPFTKEPTHPPTSIFNMVINQSIGHLQFAYKCKKK